MYWSVAMVIFFPQASYSNQTIFEGAEPDNFFWVAMRGRGPHDTVSEGWGGGGAHYRGSKSGGGEGEGLMMQSVKGGRGSSGYSERGRGREGLMVQR